MPAKPKDTSLANIVQALEKHFNPAPLEIAESFHFGTRSQKPGESIGEYVVALKKLSIHCNFGEFLNRALRDRFVCGLNNVKIQNKLLTTENITFDKACQIAKSMEMAERNTQEFHPTTSASAPSEGTVNQIESKRNDEQACYRCGGNHTAKTCRFKTAKCFKCTKVGHKRQCVVVKPVKRLSLVQHPNTDKQIEVTFKIYHCTIVITIMSIVMN